MSDDFQKYFTLSEGGPFDTGFAKRRFNSNKIRPVVGILLIAWVPLLIITAFEETIISGVRVPFLKDIAMQVRLLAALPILLLIKNVIDKKAIDLQKYLSDTLMTDEEQQRILNKILRRTRALSGSVIAEVILLLAVVVVTWLIKEGGLMSRPQEGAESWMVYLSGSETNLSLAGKWAFYFSIPLFQFLLLRWLWRYIIWGYLLYCISKVRLNLQPTHPDQAAGLGIIVDIQKYFSLIFIVISTVVSGEFIEQLIVNPGSFSSIRGEVTGYIIICLLILFFPLIFFSGKLNKVKHYGLIDLGKLGTELSSKFEAEWINGIPIEKKVTEGVVSTSTLQDYSTIFRSIEKIRSVPFKLQDVIQVVVILLIPYIPILFIHFSVIELMQKLIGLIA